MSRRDKRLTSWPEALVFVVEGQWKSTVLARIRRSGICKLDLRRRIAAFKCTTDFGRHEDKFFTRVAEVDLHAAFGYSPCRISVEILCGCKVK